MAGAPRLLAARGDVAPGWHHIEFLEGVVNVDVLRETAAEGFAEVLLDLSAADENDLAEAGPLGIENGVIQHRLAAWADGVHLFQSAVTGADSGRQNH